MYSEFSVTGMYTDLSQKSITIETNFKIEASSVDFNSIKLLNVETNRLEFYELSVIDKKITLTLKDWPSPNTKYILAISGIKDLLDRAINSPIERTIFFESDIIHKVEIVTPFYGEAFKDNTIEVEIKATPDDQPVPGYYYEIASDVAFYNVVKTIYSQSNIITMPALDNGQYFVRCRVQDQSSNQYGDWSPYHEFIMINTDSTEPSAEDNPFVEDILSMNDLLDEIDPPNVIGYPTNGTTSNEIYIIFDKPIDPSSIPANIAVYRRDL